MLDDKAKKDYEERLKELHRDTENAKTNSDMAAVDRLNSESKVLTDELSMATGWGGGPRSLGANSLSESARTSVTKCKKRAIDRLKAATPRMPNLVGHLTDHIKPKDRSFVYEPPTALAWVLD